MQPAPPAVKPRRRRIWPWVLGICLAPYLFLGLVALSYLSLNSDAARLRNELMAASESHWTKTVQFNVGGITLNAVGYGLSFARNRDVSEAAEAVKSIKHASVGVYTNEDGDGAKLSPDFLTKADAAMARHGWKRMVGVFNENEKVLIYVSPDARPGSPIELCLAVMQDKEMVVVSTRVDFDQLAAFAELKQGGSFMRKLHLSARNR